MEKLRIVDIDAFIEDPENTSPISVPVSGESWRDEISSQGYTHTRTISIRGKSKNEVHLEVFDCIDGQNKLGRSRLVYVPPVPDDGSFYAIGKAENDDAPDPLVAIIRGVKNTHSVYLSEEQHGDNYTS